MPRAEQLRLYAEHEPAALRIARAIRRKVPPSVQLDDLESAARAGLWDAVSRGDSSGESFEWYAACRVRGSIKDELRRHDFLPRRERARRRSQLVYLDQLSDRDQERMTQEDPLDVEEILDAHQRLAQLLAAVEQLHARDREVFLLALQGVKQKDIALKLGVSEPRVSQLFLRARTRLSKILQTADAAQSSSSSLNKSSKSPR